jgi:hypothetical protein
MYAERYAQAKQKSHCLLVSAQRLVLVRYIDASFNPSLIEQGSSRSHSDPASKPADSYGKLTLSDAPSDAGYDAVPNMLIEDHCKLID